MLVRLTSVLILSLFLAGAPRTAIAAILIPKSLTSADREEALRTIGLGTSAKLLSDPYPLGGYAGFEVGLSFENLPTQDLGRLGAGLANPQSEVIYPRFSVGKGLFNNLDLFFHFIPYNQQSELSQWGALVRWGFYQATFLPLSGSLVAHFNIGNVSNLVTTRSTGVDLLGGVNVKRVSLYAGGGLLHADGRFIGGTSGVTSSGKLESAAVDVFHTVIGLNVHLQRLFLAAEMNRYAQSSWSAKIGLRF